MINVIQNGEIYEISFRYDPNIIKLVKNVPGRRWNPEAKLWTIPKLQLGWLINQFKGTQYEQLLHIVSGEQLNVNASLDATAISEIPDIDLTGVKFHLKEGLTPFKSQLEFMKYAIGRGPIGFILGDEQGLGKTSEIMNLALYRRDKHKYKHCLIITCINSAKYTWKDEIYTHTEGAEEAYILGTRLKRDKITKRYDAGGAEKLADLKTGHMYGNKDHPKLPYFLIMNIETIRYKSGRKYLILEELIKYANSGKLNMIALDEVHKNMSPSSLQGKCVLKLKKSISNDIEWIPMTGTLIVNKPTDVFIPLKLVNGHSFKDYYTWCQTFCVYGGYGGYDIIGYKNIPQLKSMLQNNMLRRLKKDYLDLPEKLYYTEYVENTQIQHKMYTEIQTMLKGRKSEILQQLNPLTSLLRLRQINGNPELVDPSIILNKDYLKINAKLTRLLELLEEISERREKVIVFSNWVQPITTLYKFVSERYKTVCYTGQMSEAERQNNKEIFINNPDYTVMLGTTHALGITHTLTVARNIIFYDEPWTSTDKVQAEDRIHRPGAKEPVNIYTLITINTVDEVVHKLLKEKQNISNYILDNKLDLRHNPELFDMLLDG